jgi:hypothetical protein
MTPLQAIAIDNQFRHWQARAKGCEKRILDEIFQKHDVYRERNMCVMAFASLAARSGWKCGIGKHEGETWDEEWRNVIYVETPLGQVSWHIHDGELPNFHFLGAYSSPWDGHSTEEKYERLKAMTRM